MGARQVGPRGSFDLGKSQQPAEASGLARCDLVSRCGSGHLAHSRRHRGGLTGGQS